MRADRLSVAPMMKVTDRHFRYLLRLITKHTALYTEMVNVNAIINRARNGDENWLRRELVPAQNAGPVVLQLGGSDPSAFDEALSTVAKYHKYDSVNLNCGCPSPAVQSGRFGAVLMREPELVAEIVSRMRHHCDDVTVKCRIGTCDRLSLAARDDAVYESLKRFVCTVAAAGVSHFILHARLAVLQGLDPKANRQVPPLRHDFVHRLARDLAPLRFTINGGIASVADAKQHLAAGGPTGVMLGRAVRSCPWVLADADETIFNDCSGHPATLHPDGHSIASCRSAALLAYAEYADETIRCEGPAAVSSVIQPLIAAAKGMDRASLLRAMTMQMAACIKSSQHGPRAQPVSFEQMVRSIL
jgi:tRNA-dihydrouridine synthase A